MFKKLFSIFCYLFLATASLAQNKEVKVKYISEPIKVDGVLDEPAWSQVEPATNFWQNFPTDSLHAINQAEIRMLFDDKKLYIGIKVKAAGKDYIIPSLRRDFRARGNDNITLLFDTFSDGQNAFFFGSNPEGVLREALISGGGIDLRGFNIAWDTKWKGESKIKDDHYILEWEIPLFAFKYRKGETKWRFNSYHFDTQDNERNTWMHIPQNQLIFGLAHMGDMVFEKPLGDSKSPISVIPYINSLASKDFVTDKDDFDFNIGGDAKFTIGNSLNLDLTFNPDFSQVEVDQQVTNLTRFEINLPERRQFFIDNSDLFANFGDATEANPFFSRRIGIATDKNGRTIENDIIGGIKFSGKLSNDFRIGILNMQTDADKANEITGNNNTVIALQQKVGSRSNISFMFLNRQATGSEDFVSKAEKYNRVIGLDYNLASKNNKWNGKFFIHKSFKRDVSNDDFSAGARLDYNSRNYRFLVSGLSIGENFQSDLGFIRRRDIFKTNASIERLWWPKGKSVNRYNLSIRPEVIWKPDLGFVNSDYSLRVGFNTDFKSSANFDFGVMTTFTRLFRGFDPSRSGGLALPVNSEYNYTNFRVQYRSDNRKVLSYNLTANVGEFFNGHRTSFNAALNLRVQPHFTASVNVRYDKINLPFPFSDNDIWLIGPRIDVTFNKSLFWATFIQFSSQQNNFNINSRLQWRFAPLSDLFLVYNDDYFTENSFAPRVRSINLKLTYWLYL